MENNIPEDALKHLTSLANQMIEEAARLLKLDTEMKITKERLRKLQEIDIPDYMQELGLSKVELSTGEQISFKDDVRLEWDALKKEKAFEWLEQNEFGGLIKTEVTTSFGKGELDAAKALLARLTEEGAQVALSRDVHYQTMCAFLREQIEKGEAIPLEEWGAKSIKKATIKFPKARRVGG